MIDSILTMGSELCLLPSSQYQYCSLVQPSSPLCPTSTYIPAGRFGIMQVPAETFETSYPPIISTTGQPLPHPFTYMVKAFTLVSRMTRVLLDESGDTQAMSRMQAALDSFVSSLPPPLRFDTASFQAYAAVGQGGAFALLHVSLTPGMGA